MFLFDELEHLFDELELFQVNIKKFSDSQIINNK